jgi:hypothetical protein
VSDGRNLRDQELLRRRANIGAERLEEGQVRGHALRVGGAAAQDGGPSLGRPRGDLVQQASLADTGLARHERDATVPADGPFKLLPEQRELALPPGQRGRAAMTLIWHAGTHHSGCVIGAANNFRILEGRHEDRPCLGRSGSSQP